MQFRLLIAALLPLLVYQTVAQAVPSKPYIWKNAQVVGGGFVSGIIVHPRAKGLMYCRTDIGTAYRWEPKKQRWISISDWIDAAHWNYTGTESLAIDVNDLNAVYIAAGGYTNSWAGNGAILISHDRGDDWKVVPLPFKLGGNGNGRNNGERLAVDPNDGHVLYLGTRRNGLWRSTDMGLHWSQVTSFPQPGDPAGQGLPYVMFDATTGQTGQTTPAIYVGSFTGATLYRSINAGHSWEPVNGAPAHTLPHRAAWDHARHLFLTLATSPVLMMSPMDRSGNSMPTAATGPMSAPLNPDMMATALAIAMYVSTSSIPAPLWFQH